MSWTASKTRTGASYLVIALFSLIPRVYGIGRLSFWYDETFSVLAAVRLTWIDVIQEIAFSVHPPLHFLVLRLFSIFGTSETVMRLPSAIFGAVSVVLLFRIAGRLFSQHTAWLAAALLAFSTYHVYYSQEARMYAMFVCTSLLAVDRLFAIWEKPTIVNAIVLALVNTLNLYTHYFAVFVWGVQLTLLLGLTANEAKATASNNMIRRQTQADFELTYPADGGRAIWSVPGRLGLWMLFVFTLPLSAATLSFAYRSWADGWQTQFFGLGTLILHILAVIILRGQQSNPAYAKQPALFRLLHLKTTPLFQFTFSTILAGFLFLPWSVFMVRQFLGRGGQGIGHASPGAGAIMLSLIRSYGGNEPVAWLFLAILLIGLVVGRGRWYGFILGFWVLVPLVFIFAANQIVQFVTLRNLIFILPAYLLLLAESTRRIGQNLSSSVRSRLWRTAAGGLPLVVLAAAAWPLTTFLASPEHAPRQMDVPIKPAWRAAARTIVNGRVPGQLLIFPALARNRLPIRQYIVPKVLGALSELPDQLAINRIVMLGETHTFSEAPVGMPLFFPDAARDSGFDGLTLYQLEGEAILRNRLAETSLAQWTFTSTEGAFPAQIEISEQPETFTISAPAAVGEQVFASPIVQVVENSPFLVTAELIGVENAVFTYFPRAEIQFLRESGEVIQHLALQIFSQTSVPSEWQPVYLSGSIPEGASQAVLIYRIPSLQPGETTGLRNPGLYIPDDRAIRMISLPNTDFSIDNGYPFAGGDQVSENSIPDGWSMWDGKGQLIQQVELALVQASDRSGGAALQIKSQTADLDTVLASPIFPVISSSKLSVSGWVSQSTAGMRTRMEIQFFDKAGHTLDFIVGGAVQNAMTWERLEVAGIVPEDAAKARIRIRLVSATGPGDTLWVDGISLISVEQAASD